MVRGAVFQMGEAASEDQEVLGRLRKRSQDPYLYSDYQILLVAIVHHKMKLETSVYNALQVLGISLTDTTPLADLFNKSNFNVYKELDGFYEPTLFDF